MQKVYLLLRNNQQTGPYTLEEILQLNLKPFDLVWEEGRSAAWRYPSEIPSLEVYVITTPKPETPYEPVPTSLMEQDIAQPTYFPAEAARKVFVSMPGKAASAPAQPYVTKPPFEEFLPDAEVGKSTGVQSYAPQKPNPAKQHGQNPLEENPIEPYNYSWEKSYFAGKKKSSLNRKDIVIISVILLVTTAGYFILFKPYASNPIQSINKIAVLPADQTPGGKDKVGTVINNDEVIIEDENSTTELRPTEKIFEKNTNTKIKIPVPPLNQMKDQRAGNNDPGIVQTPVQNEEAEELATAENADEPLEQAAEPKKEKKKLKDIVRGIFSKNADRKSGDEDGSILEEPRRATDRKARKREENNFPVSDTDLALLSENIDLSSNNPDNWMMGIKGLKVTLRNRNTVALQTAIVHVSYFDANNKFLEKKSVEFMNVPANGKITLQAPDHKWADHAELSLGNISIRKDVYAKD